MILTSAILRAKILAVYIRALLLYDRGLAGRVRARCVVGGAATMQEFIMPSR